jgi:hypothetical protein
MADSLPINVCSADTPDGVKDYVICIPIDTAFEHGLIPETIIGVLLQPVGQIAAITPEVFARNRAFVDFLHDVISRRGPSLPGLIAEARRQGEGWVCIIDQRTRNPQGHIPPEDIIGVFAVRGGQVVPDSYQRCPKHMILSADGFLRLEAGLQACLLEELTERAGQGAEADRGNGD